MARARRVYVIFLCTLALTSAFAAPKFNSIHNIDFRNLTFLGVSGLIAQSKGYLSLGFRLRNGKYGSWRDGLSLRHVAYGDLTGDGKDEAIVVLDVDTEGSQGVSQVYIFTLYKGRPIAFWGFEAGDRGEGGLRQIFTKNGRLVIDLFSKGATVKNISADAEVVGLANAKFFTRSVYEWDGKGFNQFGKEIILDNPAASSACPTCFVSAQRK